MTSEQFANLPNPVAMLILIVVLVALQRKEPRIAIGSWILGLSIILVGQISWFFTTKGLWYSYPHTFRLCCDLCAGMIFVLLTGRPLVRASRFEAILACNGLPFLVLEVLYGLDVTQPGPYLLCAACGAAVCIAVAISLHRNWLIPFAEAVMWIGIATFAHFGNYRASAYWGLGTVYVGAALHSWARLRKGTLGRLVVILSLSIWAASFFIHPWALHSKLYFDMSQLIWDMQKFFVAIGVFLALLEDKARENEYLALHDQLTGLANRRLMEQRLQVAIESGPTHVVLLDLNGFKNVNDSFGHHAGDMLLRIVAGRLKLVLGDDETLSRHGGDEFVIVTPHQPEQLASAVRFAVSQPVKINETNSVNVHASIGIASFPLDTSTDALPEIADRLLRLADHRMYLDKQSHA